MISDQGPRTKDQGPRTKVLIVSTTTGYQTRSFGDAAARLGVELVFATDRCHLIDDPWRDSAIPIRFHEEDASVAAILGAVASQPVQGVLALGDRPTVIAARVALALGLPGNCVDAATASRNKLLTRQRLTAAGLPAPWFRSLPLDRDPHSLTQETPFPCVVKPLALSGSRGVIRADNGRELVDAFDRVRRILRDRSVRAMRDPAHDAILVEGFVEGREFALEGVIEHGRLQTLALFDKPDPLDGPFFEETIYVTPSRLPPDAQEAIRESVSRAVEALGLRHGPVHAECRMSDSGVTVLEVAARPIGGLCARAIRFEGAEGDVLSLEELILRHALGESLELYAREAAASGVMMVPIPKRGVFRRVEHVDEATAVPGVTEIRITAKPDQTLIPLPEGASYLGFIFARGETPARVEQALRSAHQTLQFVIDRDLTIRG